ncbi:MULTISPECIES: dienelactone hydrolase family protein [Burkholderiaceae]|uniref:Carboxymethylenebutenolidase 2 n=11 Tax=Burkholderiaceae TaxID=119060 RepID=TFDE2_CUPPJ|nr:MULTISPECIES: dienelactone hydrolase family protein [Burkholderiaceae]P94136.1 RecName: Full=Carboxymethylenebutenolidase 2; AltName: Full=Carboxymethylenebutenolidase II; AltName: Full=Dienelactone hydrolase II; Short=DLH II [Cupriavidus pinatubonensis JMP134]CDS81803.1 Carboxymethylenebutenolidase 2 [Burkholderia sp. TGCL-27]CDS90605.1 Carboxymethylenebutenolidase 2 [Cupriavidus sp. STW8_1]CDS90654.1 Carboxymethylenebutenolidase 2 [Cupriavidus sp. TGCL-2]CDS90799.1 Carboxymethylenebutenol
MCHDTAPALFPRTASTGSIDGAICALCYAGATRGPRLLVLPDIYGCNAFYRGYAAYLAEQGAGEVLLVDPFAAFGELATVTREAAFQRRHRLADRAYVEELIDFIDGQRIEGVVGFCLGGLFVFELARQQVVSRLVAYYPFPQGLENRDPLDVPFDYLPALRSRHTVIVGDDDALLGTQNLQRLQAQARANDAIDLHIMNGAGHGFLADLESPDTARAAVAKRGLRIGTTTLLGG